MNRFLSFLSFLLVIHGTLSSLSLRPPVTLTFKVELEQNIIQKIDNELITNAEAYGTLVAYAITHNKPSLVEDIKTLIKGFKSLHIPFQLEGTTEEGNKLIKLYESLQQQSAVRDFIYSFIRSA